MRFLKSMMCAALIVLTWSGSSQATLVFTGSSGSLSAEAEFSLSGSTLTVTLRNTSLADVLIPTDVLTGVFFTTAHTLTPVSASLGGSTVYYGSISDLGGGWGYASPVSAQGENSAISASGAVSGLGHSNFSVLSNNLDGLDYGILSAGDLSATGNTGVTGHGPLIKNSVEFTFTVAPGFALSELGDSVVFQYGTDLHETQFDGGIDGGGGGGGGQVPEPSALLLLGGGLIGLTSMRLWKARR